MTKKESKKQSGEEGFRGLGGWLGGLGGLLEKLGELAEKGEELRKSGVLESSDKKIQGVYGFSIKVGAGQDGGLKVEPFGNVRKDEETGKTVVDEIREPMVDIFEEQDHVLVVAEMPGISQEETKLDLKDDILTITAAHGDKKYHKEVLLPAAFAPEKMSHSCHNGVLEVRFAQG
jgi:HSP20 family protein